MRLPNIIRSQQFSRELLEDLFKLSDAMRNRPGDFRDSLKDKIMINLFYEESTRTRMSFESAIKKLGGHVIGTENAEEFSSAAKGESLEDTIRVVSGYCDVIVLRHKEEGSSEKAAKLIDIPLINAGDGKGQHPTQAFLDVYTIWREFGKVDDLHIAMVGDLAHGRTVRSLVYLCSKFNNINLTFVSPPHLKIGKDIKSHLDEHNISYDEIDDLNKILPVANAFYLIRNQKERMSEETKRATKKYEEETGKFVINDDNIKLIREDARILHPLPHLGEIQLSFKTEQKDPRVAYFRQAQNGLYARMALLHHLLYRKSTPKKTYQVRMTSQLTY